MRAAVHRDRRRRQFGACRRNPAGIREAIKALAADRGRREVLGRIARERAAAAESADDILRRLRLLSPAAEASR